MLENIFGFMKVQETARGTVIEICVKPSSKQFEVEIEDNEFMVHCRERPVKGKVNKELVKELSRIFKRKVEILSGLSSRQKRILIRDADGEEVRRVFSQSCGKYTPY